MVGNELNLIVFFKNNFTRRVCQLYPSYNSLFNSIFFCAFYAFQHWIKLTVNRSAALGNPPPALPFLTWKLMVTDVQLAPPNVAFG